MFEFIVEHIGACSYALMVLLYVVAAAIYGKEGHGAMRMCYYINAVLHLMLFVEHVTHL